MDPHPNLKNIQALWTLRLIPTDDLPKTAINLLIAGIDSKSLIKLAGMSPTEPEGAQRLFKEALIELGQDNMGTEEVLKLYAAKTSNSILLLETMPLEGAKIFGRQH